MSDIIERAQQEAERRWPPSDGWQDVRRIWTDGATFAATITPEQVEAAARAVLDNFNPPDREHSTWWIDPEKAARAALIAVGLTVEG